MTLDFLIECTSKAPAWMKKVWLGERRILGKWLSCRKEDSSPMPKGMSLKKESGAKRLYHSLSRSDFVYFPASSMTNVQKPQCVRASRLLCCMHFSLQFHIWKLERRRSTHTAPKTFVKCQEFSSFYYYVLVLAKQAEPSIQPPF